MTRRARDQEGRGRVTCLSKRPTPIEIELAKTPAGGWSRAQLNWWGVAWPPPKGWRALLELRAQDDAARALAVDPEGE